MSSENTITDLSEEKNPTIKCNKCSKDNNKEDYLVIWKLCKKCRQKNKDYKLSRKDKKTENKSDKSEQNIKDKKEKIIKIYVNRLIALLDTYKIDNKERFINELLI